MTIPRQDITGAVLAGGQGRRMGGVDKGLMPYRGTTLAGHAIERLSPQVGALIVSANRNLGAYAAHGHPVVSDAQGMGPLGPLAGLLAALGASATPWLVTVPCDCPGFPSDLVDRLAEAAQGLPPHAAVAVAATPGDARHPVHPVFCLAHRSVRDGLAAYLGQGGRAVQAWLAQVGAVRVPFDDPREFFNINAPADFAAAESAVVRRATP